MQSAPKALCTLLSYEFSDELVTGRLLKWRASAEPDQSILLGSKLTLSFVLFSSRLML